ncbi:MAG TPA: hypothetical protein VFD73_25715, partial [Gemmatimonadales bacterium]|nr:hypothetical protein [Gemmatimonadales bacterium]
PTNGKSFRMFHHVLSPRRADLLSRWSARYCYQSVLESPRRKICDLEDEPVSKLEHGLVHWEGKGHAAAAHGTAHYSIAT